MATDPTARKRRPIRFGLSARLLVLTISFVMLSEVLIYAPSIGRFRQSYLEQKVAASHLASLALLVPEDQMVGKEMRAALLDHAGVLAISLRRAGRKELILEGDMPSRVDKTVNLAGSGFFMSILQAFETMMGGGNRKLRVMGPSPKNAEVMVEIVVDEAPLYAAMIEFSIRILALSLMISFITALLVFLSLQWLFVRPMRDLTASIIAFRDNPDDGRRLIVPGKRSDELGLARRELAGMQRGLRRALIQRTRLAAIGTAVTKINHDLRNILATAQLVSDHLETTQDPQVRRVAPTLLGAIDRAVSLCTKILGFVQEGNTSLEMTRFHLRPLLDEVSEVSAAFRDGATVLDYRVDAAFELHADRDQIYRVLANLFRNAAEAGAERVTVKATAREDEAVIEIADDGPGLPETVRETLFQPFSGSTRTGGSGLGLAIARDLMRGHGGDVALRHSGPEGTTFVLTLPVETQEATRAGVALFRG